MKNIKYITTAILGAFIALGVSACGTNHDTAAPERPVVDGVEVARIMPEGVGLYHEATGTVRARTSSKVSSRIMGSVTEVLVTEGERVKKGQTLLKIDDRDLRAKVAAAQQGHNEARRAMSSAFQQKELAATTYERYKKLHDEKALSTQELDNMATRKRVAEFEYQRVSSMVKRAEAGLREARVFRGFATVTSPVDGVVSQKNTDPGSMATPGATLMVIEDDSAYRIEVGLDERLLGKVSPGMEVDVEFSSMNSPIAGKVEEVVNLVDPASRTFLAKIALDGKSVKSGQYGKARFLVGQGQALLVPQEALVKKGQLTGLYVVKDDGVIAYRLVKAGKRHGGTRAEIISGITAGEKVIIGNASLAFDGAVLKGAAGAESVEVKAR